MSIKRILVGFSFLYLPLITMGQISVTPSDPFLNNIQTIIASLVGEGVIVSNISSNQLVFSDAYGTFSETSGNLGISSGLIMTSGSVFNALGPNYSSSASTNVNATPSSDAQLEALSVGSSIYDPCIIEFDITTSSKKISFNYIFASEEYPEFVGTGFNDVFGFFLSGPGIVGQRNIAVLPGSSIPVAINNVNQNLNTTFYNSNGDGLMGGGTFMQYDGYTVRMTAVADIFPCETYHIKLAIADVGDGSYDSGVFIESGSLTGTDGIFIGSILAPDSLNICSSDLPITLKAGLENVPTYNWFKNNVIDPNQTQFYEVSTSGWYKVTVQNGIACSWADSIEIAIDQVFTLSLTKDTTICEGQSVPLEVTVFAPGVTSFNYNWSPTSGLTSNSIYNPIATPNFTTDYLVTVQGGICIDSEFVKISVINPVNLIVNNVIAGCINEEIQLTASGADTYQWTPAGFLNNASIANPLAIISVPTLFTVFGTNACFNDQKDVLVNPYFKPIENAYGDTAICYGGTAQLNADYNPLYTYEWFPSIGLSSSVIPNPTATLFLDQEYVLEINHNGCIKYDTVKVGVGEDIRSTIFLPIKEGQTPWKVKFRNFSIGAIKYEWTIANLNLVTQKEPTVTIQDEGYFDVVLKAIDQYGCFDFDTIQIKAFTLFIPNLITPNGDTKNDSFRITGLGDGYSLEIFNRWGDRVYSKSNYRNEWTGEGLTDGIYYFSIVNEELEKEYKGWVQLLR